MRLSLTILAAALVCASACDRGSLGGGTGSAGGAAGYTASGGAGATGTSNAGGPGTPGAGATDPIGATGGQAGAQACETSAACACDSQAPECQPVLMTACLGQHCPPSLDDARLVANWSLGSASGPATGRPRATYGECPDGSRSFYYQVDTTRFGFGFNASGRLLIWYTSDSSSCAEIVCGASAPSVARCSFCAMFSDPQPEGTFLIPRGISNGPGYNCEIDADGRWSMPHLAPLN